MPGQGLQARHVTNGKEVVHEWQGRSDSARERLVTRRADERVQPDEAVRAPGLGKDDAAALRARTIPEGATLHALRHTFASALIADGCDVVTVQRTPGHSSPSITLNVYSHLWPSAEDRTRATSAAFMTTSSRLLRTLRGVRR